MNTSQKEKYYDIVNGPNKDALFDACKYACVKDATIPINFEVAAAYTMPKTEAGSAYVKMPVSCFRIIGIENEDGSGESFNIHGYCIIGSSIKKPDDKRTQRQFKCYYNTKHRSGTITFI